MCIRDRLDAFNAGSSMTGDGNFVVFSSDAADVVPGDTLGASQVYVVDRTGSGSVGENYCTAIPNSTGTIGQLSGTGTSLVAYNQITLSATQLPMDSFGVMITSRIQSFFANPGGSFGNICLGGPIGRYIGPGQVQNSGLAGRIDLTIDLNAMPQPSGFDVALAGDEWNFQLWHRDFGFSGVAGSNFTNGLSVTLR